MVDIHKELEPQAIPRETLAETPVGPMERPAVAGDNLEVESWIAKIEKKFARVPNQTSDVTDDTVVVQQPQAQQPPVTLPVNQQQMQTGRKAKTDSGIAWLVTWAVRQIKMLAQLGKRVQLANIPEVKPENQESKPPR